MYLAKRLEDHMLAKDICEDIKSQIKDIDEYTQILMSKTVSTNKKSKKFTRTNFVLEKIFFNLIF